MRLLVLEDDATLGDEVTAYVFLDDGEMANAAMVRFGFALVAPSAAGSKQSSGHGFGTETVAVGLDDGAALDRSKPVRQRTPVRTCHHYA